MLHIRTTQLHAIAGCRTCLILTTCKSACCPANPSATCAAGTGLVSLTGLACQLCNATYQYNAGGALTQCKNCSYPQVANALGTACITRECWLARAD